MFNKEERNINVTRLLYTSHVTMQTMKLNDVYEFPAPKLNDRFHTN